MKLLLGKILIGLILALVSWSTSAAGLPYAMQVQNPERDIAYFVGDVIKRTVELDVKAPYELAPGSVPTKGVMRKGIELREVGLTDRKSSDATHYRLQLTYQVFNRGDFAKKLELPQELLQLTNGGKPIPLIVPAWQFQVSPISARGEVYIEKDMSPYRGPLLVKFGYLKPLLAVFLLMVLAAMCGLTYINGDANWFPGMGGPFAASYRRIAGLPHSPEGARAAATSIHQAFNRTHGENVFFQNLDQFLQNNPGFQSARAEIATFFDLSNHLLYGISVGNQPSMGPSMGMPVLLEFCKRCRDCERGVA